MRSTHAPRATLALVLLLPLGAARADGPAGDLPPHTMEPVTVSEDPLATTETWQIEGDDVAEPSPDTAAVLRAAPGAAVNWNGPLAGQVQYRGLFGPRMNVLVDGMYMNPGGPNWMDPPLHYLPRPLLDELELERGIAPVSSGAETFGGTVRATTKRSRFTDSPRFEAQGDVEATWHDVDDGWGVGGMVGAANDTHRLHVLGARQKGDDRRFGGGTIRPTLYERNQWGGGYGLRLGAHEVGLDFTRTDTDDAGTPGLPMDIRIFDTERARASHRAEIGEMVLASAFYYNNVDHKMDNFTLRPEPASPAAFRSIVADSEGFGFDSSVSVPLIEGTLKVGVDGHHARHEADIFNPNAAAFFVESFNDVERDRWGTYVEWAGPVAGALSAEVGVRYTRIAMDAGTVDALPAQLMTAPRTLRDAFNAADRERNDDNVDAVLELSWEVRPEFQLVAGVARKTRSPSYFERYLWIPLEITGGLNDGNNYVGDPGLDPEESLDAELGFDWRSERLYFSPRAFYRHVDDYIQGTPATETAVVMVSTANGDPTPLRWSNVDARLFGVDVVGGGRIWNRFFVDGTLSWVQGERRDVGDDLFRVAPLRGRVALSYRRESWVVSAEGVFADRQDDVSETNDETETAGWGILNLLGRYRFARTATQVEVGVTNVLDKEYEDHLASINRVAGTDVPLRDRLPGDGRNVYVRVVQRW